MERFFLAVLVFVLLTLVLVGCWTAQYSCPGEEEWLCGPVGAEICCEAQCCATETDVYCCDGVEDCVETCGNLVMSWGWGW